MEARALPLKVLSLRQPWAQLVVLGLKRWETRAWSTNYRGQLAIHAATRRPFGAQDLEFDDGGNLARLYGRLRDAGYTPATLPRGAVVGAVMLDQVLRIEDLCGQEAISTEEAEAGNYTSGRFAWRLSHATQCEPIQTAAWAAGLQVQGTTEPLRPPRPMDGVSPGRDTRGKDGPRVNVSERRALFVTNRQAALLFLLIEEDLSRSPGRSRSDELMRLARKVPGLWLRAELRERWKTLVGWSLVDGVPDGGEPR